MAVDITITSFPDTEGLVAEIWINGDNVATLFEAGSKGVAVEIYAANNGEPYRFQYEDLLTALTTAHRKLSEFS